MRILLLQNLYFSSLEHYIYLIGPARQIAYCDYHREPFLTQTHLMDLILTKTGLLIQENIIIHDHYLFEDNRSIIFIVLITFLDIKIWQISLYQIYDRLQIVVMPIQKTKFEEDQASLATFKTLFYPQFPPGVTEAEFLSYYQPLFQELSKLDSITEQEFKKDEVYCKHKSVNKTQKYEELQKILDFIIEQLNNLCTFCHRKELRMKITSEIAKYQKNLKNIAVGKKQIRISYWEEQFYFRTNIDELQFEKKQKIIPVLDKIYVQHKKIPNYYMLFLSLPDILIKLYDFEECIIYDSKSDKTSMPLPHKYFLGILAASTFGCKYMWNLMASKFIRNGGDIAWIINGIDQYPESIKKFSQLSYQTAFHFKINILQELCCQLGKLIEDSAILEGFYVLSYFQFLSCVSLAFGLIPQSTEYQVYLPQVPYIKPSLDSFETMKKASKKEQKYQNQIAQEFQQMYSWDTQSDKENVKRVELELLQKKSSIGKSKKLVEKALVSSSGSSSSTKQFSEFMENELMVAFQEEEIIKKIKASKTMKNIEDIYGKYVQFDKRRSLLQFNRNSRKIKASNENQENSSSSDQAEYDFIYASQWNFTDNTGNLMEEIINPTFHKKVGDFLTSLKFVEKQKSRNLKIYFESLQNYMYEYISYVSLINQGLGIVQKNYVKLLTRSPFLFNQKSFLKMKEDLETVCKICKPFRFCLQIFSFKLEHSFSLLSYAYYRYLENK